jgi:hypothetical protein
VLEYSRWELKVSQTLNPIPIPIKKKLNIELKSCNNSKKMQEIIIAIHLSNKWYG